MRRSLIIASAAAAGLVAGAMLRLVIAPPDHGETDSRRRFSKLHGARAPRGAAEPLVPPPALDDVLAARGGKRWRLAAAWLLGAGPGEIADLAAKCRTERLPPDDPLWTLLMTRWAELDSAGLMAWARKIPDDRNNTLRIAAWTAWTAADPHAAAEAARKDSRGAQAAVLNSLAAADPDAALVFARSLPEGEAALWGSALDTLAAHWPDLEFRLKSPAIRRAAQVAAARALALTEPGRAIREAAKLPVADRNDMPLVNVMKHAAATDPVRAAAAWEALPKSQAAAVAALELVRAWALQDPDRALAWAESKLPFGVFDRALTELAMAQSSRNPAAALEYLARSKGPGRNFFDVEASPLRLRIHGDSDSGSYLLGGVTNWIRLAEDIARHLPAHELADALRPVAAAGQPASLRRTLIRPALDAATDRDPASAVAVLTSGILTPEDQWFYADRVLGKIAAVDPRYAAASLSSIPAGADAYEIVAREWIRTDEEAASLWARDLVRGPNRDSAAGEIVDSLLQRPDVDYEAALAWAGDIDARKERQISTEAVWKKWLQLDEPAALDAMRTVMSAADVERLYHASKPGSRRP